MPEQDETRKTIVNSWNEWDPLKHVIVGHADGTGIPQLLEPPDRGGVVARKRQCNPGVPRRLSVDRLEGEREILVLGVEAEALLTRVGDDPDSDAPAAVVTGQAVEHALCRVADKDLPQAAA